MSKRRTTTEISNPLYRLFVLNILELQLYIKGLYTAMDFEAIPFKEMKPTFCYFEVDFWLIMYLWSIKGSFGSFEG